MLYRNVMSEPVTMGGCPSECSTFSYDIRMKDQLRNQTQYYLADRRPFNLLFALSSDKRVVQEFRVYDLNRLVGNVGGVMGLFVGLSFFSIVEPVMQALVRTIGRCSRPQKVKGKRLHS